jgi:hypothetical protein
MACRNRQTVTIPHTHVCSGLAVALAAAAELLACAAC